MKQMAAESKAYIEAQEAEERKLLKIISEADAERVRQKKELDQVWILSGEDRNDAIPDINSISLSHYVIVLPIGVIIRKKKHFLAVLSLLSAMKKEPCVDESVWK